MSGMIKNLCLNPKLLTSSPSAPNSRWGATMSNVSGGLSLSNSSYPKAVGFEFGYNPDNNPGTPHGLISLPSAGDYIIRMMVNGSGDMILRTRLSKNKSWIEANYKDKNIPSFSGEKEVSCEFTAPQPCDLSFAFTMNKAPSAVIVSDFLVCSKSDWNALQSLGLNYFDYSTMPISIR